MTNSTETYAERYAREKIVLLGGSTADRVGAISGTRNYSVSKVALETLTIADISKDWCAFFAYLDDKLISYAIKKSLSVFEDFTSVVGKVNPLYYIILNPKISDEDFDIVAEEICKDNNASILTYILLNSRFTVVDSARLIRKICRLLVETGNVHFPAHLYIEGMLKGGSKLSPTDMELAIYLLQKLPVTPSAVYEGDKGELARAVVYGFDSWAENIRDESKILPTAFIFALSQNIAPNILGLFEKSYPLNKMRIK